MIRNPEVQGLVKPLLLAIANPNKHAKPALDTLLQTVFINTVDAPSLALIVPVIHRGLRDRSGDAKKKAARIVGNMCALINEPKVQQMTPEQPCIDAQHKYHLQSFVCTLATGVSMPLMLFVLMPQFAGVPTTHAVLVSPDAQPLASP